MEQLLMIILGLLMLLGGFLMMHKGAKAARSLIKEPAASSNKLNNMTKVCLPKITAIYPDFTLCLALLQRKIRHYCISVMKNCTNKYPILLLNYKKKHWRLFLMKFLLKGRSLLIVGRKTAAI